MFDKGSLSSKTYNQIKEIAKTLQIKNISRKNKKQLIAEILEISSPSQVINNENTVDSTEIKTTSKNKEVSSDHSINKIDTQIQTTGSNLDSVQSVDHPDDTTDKANIQENLENSTNTEISNNTNQTNGSNNNNGNNGNNANTILLHEPLLEVDGILDIMPDNSHGILRTPKLSPSDKDVYISISHIKKLKLRRGDFIEAQARLPKDNERYRAVVNVTKVNGIHVEEYININRVHFDELKPIYPNKQIKLEIGQYPIANRIIDILSPVGFGQRGMIVAPPKAGKTYLLKDIAKGINTNYPNIQLIIVLIGERPEEVTDIERSVNGIVYASNFDEDPKHQVLVAELALERSKRLVESGKDVVILMDSLTRLARAYNVALPASGRTLSGGLDPNALYPSKRFFGAARNFENGASLTIIATALVDTGSKMDDVIFEEFKGTGNMELKLDRKLANQRVFPAIDVVHSGTRNEELLLGTEGLQISWKIRRMLKSLGDDASTALIDRLKSTYTNNEFINTLHSL
ncbi:MAG: transcription termination factor Rho [Candidatus Dojkabacteria bacterium]|nr:transcription termination factor Rho [Candidatus Dojkabacteria bacterium]